jgi:chromatin assembly factor 1 subunit B
MKCQIPEISWHNRDPVLSVDIQPINKSGRSCFHRLASGGSDTHVLVIIHIYKVIMLLTNEIRLY